MNRQPVLLRLTRLFTAMALMTYEIALTRVISVILNYHLVFVVISFVLLGLGIGGFIQRH